MSAGSLASLGQGAGKAAEEEAKAKGAKKRRPSRARGKGGGAHGAGSISSGSVLDENLQGPGGGYATGLSPQHLAQLAQMLQSGETTHGTASKDEMLELLLAQQISPLGAALSGGGDERSPMHVLEAGLLGPKQDGSPFDFHAALQDLSPQTFGTVSALPQLIGASPMAVPPAELRGTAEAEAGEMAAGQPVAVAEAAGRQLGKAAAKATPTAARGGTHAGAASGGEGSTGKMPTPEEKRLSAGRCTQPTSPPPSLCHTRARTRKRISHALAARCEWRGRCLLVGSLFEMLDGLDDRNLCGELKAGDQAELKVGNSPSLLMPPPPLPPPRNTPAAAGPSPSSGLRVSSSDDWMSMHGKASPPQMLLTEQLSPLNSPHLTDLLTNGF